MAFEEFPRQHSGGRRLMVPSVTVRYSGQSYISGEAVKQYGLGNYRFCVLYFDKDKSLVGFKFVDDPKINAVRLSPSGTVGHGFLISMKLFFNHYNIDPKTLGGPARFYLQKSEEEENLFFIDLNKPLESKRDE